MDWRLVTWISQSHHFRRSLKRHFLETQYVTGKASSVTLKQTVEKDSAGFEVCPTEQKGQTNLFNEEQG